MVYNYISIKPFKKQARLGKPIKRDLSSYLLHVPLLKVRKPSNKPRFRVKSVLQCALPPSPTLPCPLGAQLSANQGYWESPIPPHQRPAT